MHAETGRAGALSRLPWCLLGLFMIYPILWSLWMSFQTGKGMNFQFGGFANIVRLTKDPVFLHALTNTLIFLVVQVPIMIVLALLFAVALNNPKLRGRAILAHGNLSALRDLAGRLFGAVQVDVRGGRRGERHACWRCTSSPPRSAG